MKLFNDIEYLETVNSTNTYLKHNPPKNTKIVYTYNQTAGKGRKEKKWRDIKNKSLAVSLYFKEDICKIFYYVASLSLSGIKILKKLKLENCWIKWPNDIFVKDRKIAGILTENIFINNKIEGIIIGMGINVNHSNLELTDIEQPATSIHSESGKKYKLEDIFTMLLEEMNFYFSILFQKDFNFILSNWEIESNILTKKVETKLNNKIVTCNILDVNNDGSLKVFYNGKFHSIFTGKIK